MIFDYLIVGAGLAGSVLAERLASQRNKKVLIVEKRAHIGGNAYDHYNNDGILVHKYGPHIFHTNSLQVFEYLSQFTEWRPYQHRVLASVDRQLVPIPINLDTCTGYVTHPFSNETIFILARRQVRSIFSPFLPSISQPCLVLTRFSLPRTGSAEYRPLEIDTLIV